MVDHPPPPNIYIRIKYLMLHKLYILNEISEDELKWKIKQFIAYNYISKLFSTSTTKKIP